MITQGKAQKGKPALIKEMKLDFTRQDDSATNYISLQSMEVMKTVAELRIYDMDNHLISKGEPVKVALRRGEVQESYWSFPLSALQPGVYRADALLGDAVAWRGYFRLRE